MIITQFSLFMDIRTFISAYRTYRYCTTRTSSIFYWSIIFQLFFIIKAGIIYCSSISNCIGNIFISCWHCIFPPNNILPAIIFTYWNIWIIPRNDSACSIWEVNCNTGTTIMHISLWININWITNFLSSYWCSLWFIDNNFPFYITWIFYNTIFNFTNQFFRNRNLITYFFIICILLTFSRCSVNIKAYSIFLFINSYRSICWHFTIIYFCCILNLYFFTIWHTRNGVNEAICLSSNALWQIILFIRCNSFDIFEFENISLYSIRNNYILVRSLWFYCNSISNFILAWIIITMIFFYYHIMHIINVNCFLHTCTKIDSFIVVCIRKLSFDFYPKMHICTTCQNWILIIKVNN